MIRVFASFHPDPAQSRFEGELTSPPGPLPETGRGSRLLASIPPSPLRGGGPGGRGSDVAVGKFFAVHRGHEALLREVVRRARERNARSVALTFDRHPIEVLKPGTTVPFLTTLAERLALIERLGVDLAVVARVTPEFLSLAPEQFVHDVLRDALHTVEIHASAGFRFGRGASGTLDTLRTLGEAEGITVGTLPEVLVGGERISSSRIAQELEAGQVESAMELLGRPYSVCGLVVPGRKLGRELGFPTANLRVPSGRVLPTDGIYAVIVADAGRLFGGVAHLGPRPAIGDPERELEAHLFDFEGDLYGHTLRLHFLHRLRGVESFPDLDALAAQIARDAQQARSLLPRGKQALADLAWFDKAGEMC